MNAIKISVLLFLLYLIVGLGTITHYGINWDEPAHFMRGQAFLRFFLTGKKDYSGLPEIDNKSYKQDFGYEFVDKKSGVVTRRSIYQHWERGIMFYTEDIAKRGSHPAFSDVMAALVNYILFIQLGIASDVFSYNYYTVFVAALLIGGTYLWVKKTSGNFAAIIASLSLALFPVYFAESHNNIKDIPQAVFFSFALFSFYEAITTKKTKYVLLFALWSAFAFSTKFNFVFIIPIIIVWLLLRWFFLFRTKLQSPIPFFKKNKIFLLSFLTVPIITIIVWIGTFPAMWFEPRLIPASFFYYKTIGTTVIQNFNPFIIYYLAFSTPPQILVYAFISVLGFFSLSKKKEKDVLLLVVVWFSVSIVRVLLPGTAINGGIRQVMEYIPALAILSGIGASYIATLLNGYIVKRFKKRKPFSHLTIQLLQLLVITSFIPLLFTLIKLHPNEGVYFNSFIGGLKGAKEHNIPDWGQTLGNPYRQGIDWINKNVEKDAQLSLGFELWSNLPHIWVRKDIFYDSRLKSGPTRLGEYVMSVTHKSDFLEWHRVKDLETFVQPVYEVKVDDVSLLKVWKNDMDHIKKEYKNMKEERIENVSFSRQQSTFILKLPKIRKLLRIEFENKNPLLCKDFNDYVGNIQLYRSDGLIRGTSLQATAYDFNDKVKHRQPFFLFAGESAKVIVVNIVVDDPCYSTITGADVIVMKE